MTQLDDIQLEVAWNRLISICDEGATALQRASVSVIIGEVFDFSMAIVDLNGDALAFANRSISLFNGSMGITARAVLDRFPVQAMRPGDTYICNDPWLTSGHLPDIFLCSPVFHRGRVVALAASIGHVTDIGGSLKKLGTTEVFEEGLRFPPMRLLVEGEENRDFVDFVRYNTRTPDMVLNDFYAQVGAHQVIGRHLGELLDELGHDDLTVLAERVTGRSETAMRAAIAALPAGTYTVQEMTDGVLEPALIRVAITITPDGELTIDYTGSADECSDGSINSPYACTYSEAVSMIHTIMLPDVPANAGCFRPVRVIAPEGSLFNARPGMAVNARTRAVFRANAVLLQVLGKAAPDRVMASPGLAGHYQISGRQDGQPFLTYLMLAGGMGGSAHGPGQSCLWFPGTVAATAVEALEHSAPVVVRSRRILRGTGGAGSHNGGDGEEIVLALRPGYPGPAIMSTHPQMLEFPGGGVAGGQPGTVGKVFHNGRRLSRRELNGAGGVLRLVAGDEVTVHTPGGAGYGSVSAVPD